MRVVAFAAIAGLCVVGPAVESASAQHTTESAGAQHTTESASAQHTAESAGAPMGPSSSLAEQPGIASTALFETGESLTPVGEFLWRARRALADRLGEPVRTVAGNGSPRSWASLMLFFALYGLANAALPGHRKTLLAAYFLAEDARPVHGIVSGALVALLQVLSASVLVVGGYYLFDAGLPETLDTGAWWIRRITAVGIAALGGLFLVGRVVEFARTRDDWHQQKVMSALSPLDTRIDPDNQDPAVHLVAEHSRRLRRRRRSDASWFPAVIASGTVPSPGPALVLLLAISVGAPLIGIAAMVTITVGMAVTLAVLSVATIVAKERVVDLLGSRAAHYTHLSIDMLGSLTLITFGVAVILMGIG
ncbi:MAG: hypothetical protein R6V29_08425 [Spirochaetia bacterium]